MARRSDYLEIPAAGAAGARGLLARQQELSAASFTIPPSAGSAADEEEFAD